MVETVCGLACGWPCSSNAHNAWSQKGEGDTASQPTHRGAIGLFCFHFSDDWGKLFIKSGCHWGQSFSQRKHMQGVRGVEWGVFYLTDSSFILFFFSFSWLLYNYVADIERFWLEGARGLNTLTSRYVLSKVLPQKPSTCMQQCQLRRAPSWFITGLLPGFWIRGSKLGKWKM